MIVSTSTAAGPATEDLGGGDGTLLVLKASLPHKFENGRVR